MQMARARREAAMNRPALSSADRPCSTVIGNGERHRVIIVGGGFGGLEAVIGLAGLPVSITLIDQRNYHLFQPLLYQVATASLATSEIAWPIRALVGGRPGMTTLLATVLGGGGDAKPVFPHGGRRLPY